MASGARDFGHVDLSYTLSIDDGEGPRVEETYPVGFDISLSSRRVGRVGLSGYATLGGVQSDVGVGDGPSSNGVLPWMAKDDYTVLGAYFEKEFGRFQVQAAYWHADHEARHDPLRVVQVLERADLNAAQRDRFLMDPEAGAETGNVDLNGDYEVDTWYVRTSFTFDTRGGEFTPYMFWDWYRNPATIGQKRFGGDNEAGLADDGQFHKPTLGLVYRPIPTVALKLDASSHIFELAGQNVDFPEFRLDISFLFGQ